MAEQADALDLKSKEVYKIQRSLIIFVRVQVSPGAFSQCVGIRKTRLTQNQLLKSVQVQVLSLRFYIFVHMAELADAHDLGSCAERRESSSLSMDITSCSQ